LSLIFLPRVTRRDTVLPICYTGAPNS